MSNTSPPTEVSTDAPTSTPSVGAVSAPNAPAPNATSTEGAAAGNVAQESTGSKIWDAFIKISDPQKKEKDKAKCKHCGKIYVCPTSYGTSTLWKHYHKCIKNPDRGKNKKQKCLAVQLRDQDTCSVVSVKFDQEALKKGLCRMIMVDELPFKFVEREGFRNFLQLCEPRFRMPSRFTIARGCMGLYLEEKKKVMAALESNTQRVCLTTDTWSSLQNINYMCLTVHFIDHDWKLHKRILNFCPISSHKGDDIGREIEKCLHDWKLDNVFTITVDNASSNDTAIAYLKRKFKDRSSTVLACDFIHMRCVAHILNLVVQDGLKESDLTISKIREAVRFVRASPQRLNTFKECVKHEKIGFKSHLCLDVVTRWNSTYLMLETAVKFQKAFERLEEIDSKYVVELLGKNGIPNENDWEKAKVLVKFLQAFYDVTLRISGSLYVTSNNFVLEICSILCLLNEWMKSDDQNLKLMARKMKEKFDKYWGNVDKMNMLLFVAMVLDPRYKLKYMKAMFTQVYAKDEAEKLVVKVKDTLTLLVNFYDSSPSNKVDKNRAEVYEFMDIDSKERSHLSLLKSKLKDTLEEEDSTDIKSELDKYLDEQREKDVTDFDILNWWKVNSSRYVLLSKIARDVLSIPISTVASESAFSVGGRVLDSFRSSLTPAVVQALICGQDWLRASPLPILVEENLEDLEIIEKDLSDLHMESGITTEANLTS